MEDNVVALLALDAEAQGLLPTGGLDKSVWTKNAGHAHALRGEHWLIAYEANQKGWLQSPAVAADPTFSAMSKAGVSFYDRTRNVPQFPIAARRLPGGNLPDDYA
jgi:hypothetical protein